MLLLLLLQGAFGWSYFSPAFVFPDQLANGWPKFVAESISHEGEAHWEAVCVISEGSLIC
jgi:hypothetical protein